MPRTLKTAIHSAAAESPRVMMPFADADVCEALKHQERFYSPIPSHRHFRQELFVICIVKPKFVSGTSFDPIRLLRTTR